MRTTGVLFDWDGVLIDSLGASFNVYNKIFVQLGMRALTEDEFLEVQSPNWYEFYQKVGVPAKFWEETDEEWVRLYEDERPALYADAARCLDTLKRAKLKLALVSNGSKVRIEDELEKFNLRSRFDSVLFGVGKDQLKPSPYMLEETLGVLDIKPENAVYVGDSPADIQAAKNAHVPSIALARGPIQESRLGAEHPDFVFRGLDQVSDFLVNGAGAVAVE